MSEELNFEETAPWLVIPITLLGGWLRVLLIGYKGMWLDETFSVWLAGQSVPDMLEWMVRIDQHPPLYYLLLHAWMRLHGDMPHDVRLLSALLGAATIPVIYLIGRRISGDVVGLAAAVLLALSPFHIYYAQETRMYTLLTFLAAAAIYALVRLLTDPRAARPIGSQLMEYLHAWRSPGPLEPDTARGTTGQEETHLRSGWRARLLRGRGLPLPSVETDLTWLALIVFSAATLLTHHTAVLFNLAVNLYVLGLMLFQRNRSPGSAPAFQAPSPGNWVKAQTAILLLWSPWLPAFIRQARRVDQEFWIPKPDWDAITETLRVLLNASALDQFSQVMTWILCAVLILGLVYYRRNLSIFFFLAALFAVPFLGELIVSIRRPIFLGRTLIWITIPMFLLLAAGIAQLRARLLMIVVLGVVGTNYLFSDGDYYRFYQKEDWQTPAGYVANFAEEGDLVLFNSNFVEVPFNYYFAAYEELYAIQVKKRGIPLDLFDSGILEPKMSERDVPDLIALVRGHHRVWLVYSHNHYTDPRGLIPRTLASQMKLTRTREFYGGQVQLYESP